jgi:HSP20 family protein
MARGRFFGKFMGENEEGQEEFVEEEAAEAPEETPEETATVRAKTSSRKASKVEVEEGQEEANREEWINEYEGQLTLDVYQTRDNVIIRSTIAGVRSEDLDITIANDMVTIKGERKKPEDVRPEDYFYQECYWGPFSRSIILPVDIDVEGVEADLKDGILTVTLPKAAKAKTKKIKVKNQL